MTTNSNPNHNHNVGSTTCRSIDMGDDYKLDVVTAGIRREDSRVDAIDLVMYGYVIDPVGDMVALAPIVDDMLGSFDAVKRAAVVVIREWQGIDRLLTEILEGGDF